MSSDKPGSSSAKPNPPPPPPPRSSSEELTFVVTTNPYDRSSAANKRRVRSVAALRSWPERRKKTFENVDQSGATGGFVLDLPEPASSSRPAPAKRKRKAAESEGPPDLQPRQQRPEEADDEEPLFEACTRAFNDYCNCIHCRAERTYLSRRDPNVGSSSRDIDFRAAIPTASPSQNRKKRTADGEIKDTSSSKDGAMLTPPASPLPSPIPFINNEGKAEPFNCYPVPYRPWFDRVLHHMMTVFAPRGWPALKISNSQGLEWEWFMTQHALSEPALFYVRLLFASGDLIKLQVLNPEYSYWLQAQAITAINEALSDPRRATSDALILAVGRIAMHEAFYGNKDAANIMHRPAQRRMIQMRGGMQALPFPALVKRLMRWADNVMAMRSGTERMLEDEDDNKNYSMKQQVDFLEKLVPQEGKELRKRIKIEDLLSPSAS